MVAFHWITFAFHLDCIVSESRRGKMVLDPYSSVVVDIIWSVLEQVLRNHVADYIPEWVVPVGAENADVSSSIAPCNGQDVTITVDPPAYGDTEDPKSRYSSGSSGNESCSATPTDSSYDGSQLIYPGGILSSESSQLDMSGLLRLHSSDEARKRIRRKNIVSFESSQSDMSEYHSLNSNDEPQRRTSSVDSLSYDVLSKPGTLASTEGAPHDESFNVTSSVDSLSSDVMSKPGTLASTESAPHDESLNATPPVDSLRMEDSKSSRSDVMSKAGTLASTEGTPHDDSINTTSSVNSLKTGNNKPPSSDVMSQPGTLASTESTPCDDEFEWICPSRKSSQSDMRECRSLYSNDEPQRRYMDLFRIEDSKSSRSDILSQPVVRLRTKMAVGKRQRPASVPAFEHIERKTRRRLPSC